MSFMEYCHWIVDNSTQHFYILLIGVKGTIYYLIAFCSYIHYLKSSQNPKITVDYCKNRKVAVQSGWEVETFLMGDSRYVCKTFNSTTPSGVLLIEDSALEGTRSEINLVSQGPILLESLNLYVCIL